MNNTQNNYPQCIAEHFPNLVHTYTTYYNEVADTEKEELKSKTELLFKVFSDAIQNFTTHPQNIYHSPCIHFYRNLLTLDRLFIRERERYLDKLQDGLTREPSMNVTKRNFLCYTLLLESPSWVAHF
jgi:hypothetical protein